MRYLIISAFSFFAVVPMVFAQTGGSDTPAPSQSSPLLQSTGNTNQTQSTGNTSYTPGSSIELINPLKGVDCSSGNGNCLMAFLNSILQFVIQIGVVVVILMLVYVGFLFVTARGEPGKITTARTALLWTVIGALILLGAQAIASGIQATVQALSSGN
ncbi:MAG: hypothetical protein ACYCZZ_01445 [Minisyncoccota bacterium]